MAIRNSWGEFFRQQRLTRGLPLRQFCKRYGFDPGNISKLERGLLPPPHDKDRLTRYARALGIEENSDTGHEFFNRATLARGQIPAEIFNHKQRARRLDYILQILQGRSVPAQQQADLIKFIRRNGNTRVPRPFNIWGKHKVSP